MKVMLVDDDTLSMEVAGAALESHGHTVTKRDSAFGTSVAILRDKPDIVVLDVHMPGLNGDALTRLIKGSTGTYDPILVLFSATDPLELEQLAVACGASAAVEKTSDPFKLVRRIEVLVAQKRAAHLIPQANRLPPNRT